jgi:uncharacterized membrane protein (DUF4010 family)
MRPILGSVEASGSGDEPPSPIVRGDGTVVSIWFSSRVPTAMEEIYQSAITLAVALAIGLLVGIERSWTDRDGEEGSRIAGLRTFSLIGLLGGVAVLLSREVGGWFVGVAFVAVAVLSITAHVLDVQEDQDLGTTTAFSMMLVFVLAAWAAYGAIILAMAVTVVVISLLGYKPMLHTWLKMISPQDFFAGAKLLIISLVLLPLLPNQGYGPWQALNPFWTWLMVVLISGLSFLGYVGMKLVGERAGLIMTAIVGALASSTAVTVSLARMAKQRQRYQLFASGVLLASAIMFLRVMIEIFVVYPGLLAKMWLPLSVMFAGLLAGFFWLWLREGESTPEASRDIEIKNPLQLGMALQFGAVLAVILLLSEAMKAWFGDYGIYALSVVSGVMDVDAITLSLAKSARQHREVDVAIVGILLACATNTLVKGIMFASITGSKQAIRLVLFMGIAMVPGLLIAVLW